MNAITHPKHYTSLPAKCSGCGKPIECIDVTKHMICCRSAAVKYIWRAGEKDDEIEDLQKAIQYLEFEIGRLGGSVGGDAFDRMDALYASLDSAQSAPLAAVEPQPDSSPAEDVLWRPVAGKYGRTRDGRKVGKIVPNTRPDFFAYPWSGVCGPVIINFDSHGKSSDVFDDCCDLVSEWQDEPALEMREGASYVARDGEIWTEARRDDKSERGWVALDSEGKFYDFNSDGSFWSSTAQSDQDLIREVPAPALDAQAIYDNNPADLVGSVWRYGPSGEVVTVLEVTSGGGMRIRCPSGMPVMRNWDYFLKHWTFLHLASQEAAE